MVFLFIVLLVVFILVVVASRKDSFISQGNSGETRVSYILSLLPKNEYHVFNDVYLETNGHSSQIDHIVISQYGVFVIETKNYSGSVYGSENTDHWTQYLKGDGYEFLNPIKQNQSHVLAIKETLHITPTSIIPIVVFLNSANLRCNTTSTVLYSEQLRDYILSKKTIAFTPDGVERLSQRLSQSMISDPERKQKHIHSIKKSIAERKLKETNMICPRCNGKLVERQGKYGRFGGCSNYPHCKFTTQIESGRASRGTPPRKSQSPLDKSQRML